MGRASRGEVEQLQLKRREHEGSCEEVNDTSAQGYLVRKGARAHLGRFPSRPWITHPPSWAGWMVEGKRKKPQSYRRGSGTLGPDICKRST